jgi:predicted DNA-binding transcriptional regulator AlpA
VPLAPHAGDANLSERPDLTRLRALDAASWADLKGAPLDARGLARHPRRRPMATVALIPLARKSRDKLTVAEVCEDLQVAQSTFYEWRTKGTGPRCIKLPNGQLRVRRADLESWLAAREDAA